MTTQQQSISIRDLNRQVQQIDDLDRAIEEATENMHEYTTKKTLIEFEKAQLAYWTDMHEKLSAIKTKKHNETRKKVQRRAALQNQKNAKSTKTVPPNPAVRF